MDPESKEKVEQKEEAPEITPEKAMTWSLIAQFVKRFDSHAMTVLLMLILWYGIAKPQIDNANSKTAAENAAIANSLQETAQHLRMTSEIFKESIRDLKDR